MTGIPRGQTVVGIAIVSILPVSAFRLRATRAEEAKSIVEGLRPGVGQR